MIKTYFEMEYVLEEEYESWDFCLVALLLLFFSMHLETEIELTGVLEIDCLAIDYRLESIVPVYCGTKLERVGTAAVVAMELLLPPGGTVAVVAVEYLLSTDESAEDLRVVEFVFHYKYHN